MESKLPEKARPLFVVGCPRSGTTAFADYLNQHQEVLLCQERYKYVPRTKITPDLFTFERILDYRPEETKHSWELELYSKRHVEILAKKDPAKLKWIGDKGPFYVRVMDLLAGNNPGARFIVLYRPLEEIAESWEARAKDSDDHWLSDRGLEAAVQTWNTALRKTREFVESSPAPRALLVSYHDFFYRNKAVVPLISRFLGLEFDESVTRAWSEESLKFESGRRRKEPLDEEQRSFIQEHANRAAEAWVLDRIEKQWREPGLYVEESTEATIVSLGEMEARVWRLQQKVKTLEHDLARERQKAKRLRELQSSRTWRLLNKINRIRTRVSEVVPRFYTR